MVPPLLVFLVLVAFLATIASAWNPSRCPPWIPLIVICLVLMLMVWPK